MKKHASLVDYKLRLEIASGNIGTLRYTHGSGRDNLLYISFKLNSFLV